MGLPMSLDCHKTIMVIVDKLSKVAQFSHMRASYIVASVAHVLFKDIVRLHGNPLRIILDRDLVFTSALWTSP